MSLLQPRLHLRNHIPVRIQQIYERASATAAADIYAFGCVAKELGRGEPPFGEVGLAVARRKLRDMSRRCNNCVRRFRRRLAMQS